MKYNFIVRTTAAISFGLLLLIVLPFIWLTPTLAVIGFLTLGLFDAIIIFTCSLLLLVFVYAAKTHVLDEYKNWIIDLRNSEDIPEDCRKPI